jgi:hypothetical protein
MIKSLGSSDKQHSACIDSPFHGNLPLSQQQAVLVIAAVA